MVQNGTSTVAGASVSLWAIGANSSQIGTAVTTSSSGAFTLHYDCPSPSTLMMVAAAGGHTGGASASNSHLRMVSAVGACASLASSIVINEFTTTAAAYALSGYAAAGTTAPTFTGHSPGLNQAFLTLTNLVNPATGTFPTTARETNTDLVKRRLNTVANALAACNDSSGASACAELFSCAKAGATFASTGQSCTGGTGPTVNDTLNAALAIAQNADRLSSAGSGQGGSFVSGVFDVASTTTAYAPVMAAAPEDWSLPLVFTVTNFGPLAIDASGYVWLLGPDPHPAGSGTANLAVAQMNVDGTFLSPHQTGHDWSAGGISAIQSNDVTNMAIDQSGNVWVAGSSSIIAEISSSGAAVAPAGGWAAVGRGVADTSAVTIDSSGNAWIESGDTDSIFKMGGANGTPGANLFGSGGLSTGGFCACDGMVADASGDVWAISNNQGQFVAQVDAAGNVGISVPPPSGYALAHFTAVATDANGDLWIADQHYHGVWKFTPSVSGQTGTYSSAPFVNDAAPGTTAKAMAVDGAGHKWVANNPNNGGFASLTELSADGTVNLSPNDGFGFNVNAGVTTAYGVAVDASGNVWSTDGATHLTQYVGLAAPTRNPVSSAIAAGTFAP